MKQEVFERGFYYHIYNRGNNKENIFKEDINYVYFIELIKRYLLETIEIYAFCLLPNHFHLLIKFKETNEISTNAKDKKTHQVLSNMFNAYTKAINKKYNRTGSLFQEHLQRKKVKNEEYLKELVLYIHLNPEKHKIISNFRDYRYSSYLSYVSNNQTNIKKEYVLGLFENIDNFELCHNQKRKNNLLKQIEELDID